MSSRALSRPRPPDAATTETSGAARTLAFVLALGSGALALYLAQLHPWGAVPAGLAVLAAGLLARYFWRTWPGWMLALVPAIGLAPWTGWLWLEEWHMLALASAAGGYLAWAGPHRTPPPPLLPVWRRGLRWSGWVGLMALALLLAQLIGTLRGVQDAGGLDLFVYQGYQESGQALRALAPALALLLLLPLWTRAAQRAPQALAPALMGGMLGVLLVVAGGALVERLAYTGLLNFSSDYRTTSVFWEMHIGGAALDGVLALSLPFALLALLRAQGRLAFGAALALAALGAYATLTTFSRGLYLAVALALPLLLALWWRQQARRPAALPGSVWPQAPALPLPPGRLWVGLGALLLLGGGVAWQMFPGSGYRGLLAVMGTLVALLLQPPGDASLGRAQRLTGWLLGLLVAAPWVGLCALLAGAVDKSAYVLYALTWLLSLALARAAWRGSGPWVSPLGNALRAATWLSLVGLSGVVAWNWGGEPALERAWLPLALLSLAWPLSQGGSLGALLGQVGWRPRMLALTALGVVAGVVAGLGGGSYIGTRAGTVGSDLQGRFAHWSRGVGFVEAAQAEGLGLGAGRYLAHWQMNVPLKETVGDHRWLPGDTPALRLTAGRHIQGWGEMYRLLQRLPDDVPADLQLRLRVRHDEALTLVAEVCERHLIYTAACRTRPLKLAAKAGWHDVTLNLGGRGELGSEGWPPRRLAFALAVDAPGKRVDIAALSLIGADGRELLRNGDFRQGSAHWFFSSDRNHLPWHAKSLPLHWYIEGGWLGLAVGLLAWAAAFARLLLGGAARHPLAPALAAALLGFMLVGLFDSLVDAARVQFVYLTLLLLSLGLQAPPDDVAASR